MEGLVHAALKLALLHNELIKELKGYSVKVPEKEFLKDFSDEMTEQFGGVVGFLCHFYLQLYDPQN